MANLTYGALSGSSADGSVILNPLGTDLIATSADGVEHAFAPGDIAWVLSAGALIMFMIPGLGYLYSGLARRKNALSLLFICMMALAICSFQWFFIGYSFVFSETGGVFWGDGLNVGFRNVMDRAMPESNGKLPELVFAFYQMTFACLVPAVMMGCIAERSRILPAMIFIFFWTTLVYDPLAHWIWSVNGWANKWGVLDYAGGVPVEIASGIGGLAYSYFIGKRRDYGTERILFKPQNVSQVVLGTVFLWVGWLGFNGGSCFSATLKAALAIFNTNLAGSVGAVVWLIMDFRLERKWSVVGFCTGAIAGLVAITPAAGFVSVPAAALIGLVSAVVSNLCTGLKHKMRCDDVMDIFAVHALAGIVGVIMTGFFAQSEYAATDAYAAIAGGWMNQNWIQMGKQVAWAAVGVTWTFVVTLAIMFVINLIPGCKFRASDEAQIVGMDEVELGEFAQDFVWLDRDLEGHYRTPHFKRHYQLSRSRTRNGRDASPRADVPMPAIHEHMASVDHDHYHPDSQGLGSSAGEKEKRGGAAGDRKDGASAMTGGSEASQTASEVERSHVPGLRMGEPRAGATMALRDASPASWNEKA